MDDNYCLVQLDTYKNIVLYYFCSNYNLSYKRYPICFTGTSSNYIYHLISLHSCFQNCSYKHILYIGKELYKAELSGLFNQVYIQS